MNPYPRPKSARHWSKPRYSTKSEDTDAKPDYQRKRATRYPLAHAHISSHELTLDDFGGRSDALGG
jgi:hypothetical protein